MASKSEIFAAAWTAARKGAAKFGGSAREFFSESLRMAYAFFKARAVKPASVETTTASKLDTLATIVLGWPRNLRGTFACRFILDNAERASRFGGKVKFSDKQISIINDMYVKYA